MAPRKKLAAGVLPTGVSKKLAAPVREVACLLGSAAPVREVACLLGSLRSWQHQLGRWPAYWGL